LANRITWAAPLTRIRTTGAPVTCTGAVSGADSKAALWPGTSKVSPPSEPRPGKTEIEAGAPPGGRMIVCGGPDNRSNVCLVPPRPG
jgi:hypothetical protein